MKRFRISMVLGIGLSVGSCLFQNNPLAPNNPPVIDYYYPIRADTSLEMNDTCVFRLRGSDPDGDQVNYRFMIGDSVISTSDTSMFFGTDPDTVSLRGIVADSENYVSHVWSITVQGPQNTPPSITWRDPERSNVSCTVGDILTFAFSVRDDFPEVLRYTYRLGPDVISTGDSILSRQFRENGEFTLEGIVHDGEYGDTTRWSILALGFPDTIPPSAIVDLEGQTGIEPGSVILEWTAPGDDSTFGKASEYIVRTFVNPIDSEDRWAEAHNKLNEPIPSPSGEREYMVLKGLNPGTHVYVTMRAIDDFGVMSPLGNCVYLLVRGIDISGTIINSCTGEPVAGCYVNTGEVFDTSDMLGAYKLENVPLYSDLISVRDEAEVGVVGGYFDLALPILEIEGHLAIDIPLIPNTELVSAWHPENYGYSFLEFFRDITDTDEPAESVHKNWDHWPVMVYSPYQILVTDTGDVDLQAAASGAMDEWESMTGLDLFELTDDLDGADIEIRYDSILSDPRYAKHHYEEMLNLDGTPAKRTVFIYLLNSSVPMGRYSHLVFAHELGHTLGFSHSEDPGHLMLGHLFPLVHHVTTDEANAMSVLYYTPHIFDYDNVLTE